MNKSPVLFCLLLLMSAANTHGETTDPGKPAKKQITGLLKPGEVQKTGIPLSLPKVLVTVAGSQTKSVTTAGRYFIKDYVKSLVDQGILTAAFATDENLATLESGNKVTSYELGDVTLTPFSVADQNKRFVIYPGKKWNKDQNFMISYGEGGTISSAKMENKDKTISVISDGIGVVAGIAGKVFSNLLFSTQPGWNITPLENATKAQKEKLQEKYEGLSPYEKKLLKADSILKQYLTLEVKKQDIVLNNGYLAEVGVFNKQVELIEKQQKALLELITWKTKEKTMSIQLDVDPGTIDDDKYELFYFSEKEGISLNRSAYTTSYNSYNVPEGINLADAAGDKDIIRINITGKGQQSTLKAMTNKEIEAEFNSLISGIKNSYVLPYNQPETVAITVIKKSGSEADKQMISTTAQIPQLGSVIYLVSKNQASEIGYHPLTGALKTASTSSTAVLGDDMKKIGESGEKAIDLFKKSSELEELEKQRKILEEKKKIKDLKESGIE